MDQEQWIRSRFRGKAALTVYLLKYRLRAIEASGMVCMFAANPEPPSLRDAATEVAEINAAASGASEDVLSALPSQKDLQPPGDGRAIRAIHFN